MRALSPSFRANHTPCVVTVQPARPTPSTAARMERGKSIAPAGTNADPLLAPSPSTASNCDSAATCQNANASSAWEASSSNQCETAKVESTASHPIMLTGTLPSSIPKSTGTRANCGSHGNSISKPASSSVTCCHGSSGSALSHALTTTAMAAAATHRVRVLSLVMFALSAAQPQSGA